MNSRLDSVIAPCPFNLDLPVLDGGVIDSPALAETGPNLVIEPIVVGKPKTPDVPQLLFIRAMPAHRALRYRLEVGSCYVKSRARLRARPGANKLPLA